MEPLKTALSTSMDLDQKKLKAHQYAEQIVYSLDKFIPEAAMSEARYCLYELFLREEVEITTRTTRTS